MTSRTGILAAAAASLFVAGAASVVPGTAVAADKIKCEGVNSCASHSDCKTLFSDCAGHNECAGKGFKMLTAEECEDAKAEMAAKHGDKEKM
ncbi:MAG: hypothetical protein JRH10_11905 [Deltaproteobacteria bacterium]|nr:hypothetical protein [Deltaproteobacteria bacterium]MBW2448163.1 hypothetical protein [Deltaproteobacteria bacterium]